LTQQKLIPVDSAIAELERQATALSVDPQDHKVLLAWLTSLPKVARNDKDYLALDTFRDFLSNFGAYLKTSNPNSLILERGFKEQPVDVMTFVESNDYLGAGGAIWPGVLDNLDKIFNQKQHYFEVVLTGSISGGKSTTSQLAMAYVLYLVSMLKDAHYHFDLMRGTQIVLMLQSIKLEKSYKLLFDPLKNYIDNSAYFMKNFRRNPEHNKELRFPNNVTVMAAAGTETSALGLNVHSAAFSEINFAPVIKDSQKLRDTNKEVYDTGREMVQRAKERILSRFPTCRDEGNFNLILLDSSVDNPHDLTAQYEDMARSDPTILVIKKPIWEAQAHQPLYSLDGPTFLVEVGNTTRASRIINSIDDAIDPAAVLVVPASLRVFFEQDTDEALKNYGGIATGMSGAYLGGMTDAITKAQEEYAVMSSGESLFRQEEVSFYELFGKNTAIGTPLDWSQIINYDYIENCILDRETLWSMRLDLSATKDATGLCISRIIGFTNIESQVFNPDSGIYEADAEIVRPIYCCELLRIVARPRGVEIDPNLVSALGIALKRRLNITWATADRAESSRACLMAWKKHGIISQFLSVDTSIQPYEELKSALRDNRILLSPHSTCDKELRALKRITKNSVEKIEHPAGAGGSKDVTDALAGSIYILKQKEALFRDRNTNRRNLSVEAARPTPGLSRRASRHKRY
jgi:hypothetical protein